MKTEELSSFATVSSQMSEGNDDSAVRLHTVILQDLQNELARRVEVSDGTEVSAATLIQALCVQFEAIHSFEAWATKRDFYSTVVSVVAHVLLQHYHTRNRSFVTEGPRPHPLDDALHQIELQNGFDYQDLYHALRSLESIAPHQHTIIALRIIAGMSLEEVGGVLETTTASVQRDWRLARAKLHRYLWKQTYDATATP